MLRFLSIVLIVLLAAGCASQEGISFSSSDWGVEEIIEQRESREESKDPAPGEVPTDLILIGTVSAFRPLTEKNNEKIYSEYFEFSRRLNPNEPVVLSSEDFRNEIAGWTKLKLFSIPLIMGTYDVALVPNDIHAEIRFPSSFGTVMVQESGDLLAARTNRDGYFFVKQVLCKDGRGYSACAKKYQKGLFNGSTGEELTYKTLIPKESGRRIDPVSYLEIEVQP